MAGDGGAAAEQWLALHPLQRVGACALVGALGDAHAFKADVQPRMVHHREHAGQPLVRLADQVADRAPAVAKAHRRRGAAVDAHLVLDGGAGQVVAFAQGAVVVDQVLRAQEQRDAFHAGRCIGQARQHEVDDVLGHVVLAPGDEDLVSADAVMVAFGHGATVQRGQVGACLGLGEVHGAGPAARDHGLQEAALECVAAMVRNGFHRAQREHLAQAEREVGRLPHLQHGCGHQRGQALAAPFGGSGHAVPAVLAEAGPGFAKAIGWRDLAVVPARALHVAGAVQRIKHAGGVVGSLLQDGLDQVGRGFFMARLGTDRIQASDFLHREQHVAQGRGVGRHCLLLFVGSTRLPHRAYIHA